MNIQAEFLTLTYEIVNKANAQCTPHRMHKTILECLALILVKHITKCISLPRCTENYAENSMQTQEDDSFRMKFVLLNRKKQHRHYSVGY